MNILRFAASIVSRVSNATLVGLALLSFTHLGAAKDWELGYRMMPDPPDAPKRQVIGLEFRDGAVPTAEKPLTVTSSVRSGDSYLLEVENKGKWEPVKIVVAKPNTTPTTRIVRLMHAEDYTLDKTKKYRVSVKMGAWLLADGGTFHYAGGKQFIELDSERIGINERYLNDKVQYEKKLQIQTGSTGGTVSLSWRFDTPRPENYDEEHGFFRARVLGDAKLTIPSADKHNYFNSLNVEGYAYYAAPYPRARDPAKWRPYFDIGGRVKFESDQGFDVVDLAGGVQAHLILGNPLTDWLASALVGNHRVATLNPAFTVAYDGVAHVDQNNELEETGSQRAVFGFFWRWPLAREMTWVRALGITNETFDADLRIDLEGVHDIDRSVFTNNSEITLEIKPHSDDEEAPSLTLTYARGEVKPTYENFEAFLVGFKKPF